MKDNDTSTGGMENPALQMTKLVEALINQVERVTGGSHAASHKQANKRLLATLRQVSSTLNNLATAKGDPPTPEQIEELSKILPRQSVPILPPSLFLPHTREEE